MTISEIYEKYKIPPNLQLHQLRVTGVALIICDNFNKELDQESTVTACLLHDMGNILKFNFDLFPEFTEPEGRDYWESVKEEFRQKYGSDEHHATIEITRELKLPSRIVELVDAVGFPKADENSKSEDIEKKICGYSDMRVAPKEVRSLMERLNDAKKRYVDVPNSRWSLEYFLYYQSHWEEIEKQIFDHCKIRPEDITDENVSPLVEKLRNFKIEVGRGRRN